MDFDLVVDVDFDVTVNVDLDVYPLTPAQLRAHRDVHASTSAVHLHVHVHVNVQDNVDLKRQRQRTWSDPPRRGTRYAKELIEGRRWLPSRARIAVVIGWELDATASLLEQRELDAAGPERKEQGL